MIDLIFRNPLIEIGRSLEESHNFWILHPNLMQEAYKRESRHVWQVDTIPHLNKIFLDAWREK